MLKSLFVAVVLFPLLLAVQLAEPADQAANVRISTNYHADKAACASWAAEGRGLCYEQAVARKKVARAELEYRSGGGAGDRHKLLEARAEADYSVAREMCSGMKRASKHLCVQQARTVEAKALADAEQAFLVASPRPDGVRVKRAVADPYKPAAASFKAVAL